jgi:hypothetical protein
VPSWGIAEWYGKDIVEMSEDERRSAAEIALRTNAEGLKNVPQPTCPFLDTIKPGAPCNKKGGICSIRQYTKVGDDVVVADGQPATNCPNRFLEHRGETSIFSVIAEELYGVTSGAKVIKEIPFLEKEVLEGERSAKAGRIDWILVPDPSAANEGEFPWIAIESQAVYFSGGNIWVDVALYAGDPSRLHMPALHRRPDFRSSGAKRLAPQLLAKSPVVTRWGRKIAVIIDLAFFNEMGALVVASDFDNSEVVWIITKYEDDMKMVIHTVLYAELGPSISALQAAKPVNRVQFERMLRNELGSAKTSKVFGVDP